MNAYHDVVIGVIPLINFVTIFYQICVFSSLPGHFILSLTFPRPNNLFSETDQTASWCSFSGLFYHGHTKKCQTGQTKEM